MKTSMKTAINPQHILYVSVFDKSNSTYKIKHTKKRNFFTRKIISEDIIIYDNCNPHSDTFYSIETFLNSYTGNTHYIEDDIIYNKPYLYIKLKENFLKIYFNTYEEALTEYGELVVKYNLLKIK